VSNGANSKASGSPTGATLTATGSGNSMAGSPTGAALAPAPSPNRGASTPPPFLQPQNYQPVQFVQYPSGTTVFYPSPQPVIGPGLAPTPSGRRGGTRRFTIKKMKPKKKVRVVKSKRNSKK